MAYEVDTFIFSIQLGPTYNNGIVCIVRVNILYMEWTAEGKTNVFIL